tara:strand:+ start:44 stop:250 length:207 start_codon:yes stop_codon:yes gene_type:complete
MGEKRFGRKRNHLGNEARSQRLGVGALDCEQRRVLREAFVLQYGQKVLLALSCVKGRSILFAIWKDVD